MTGSAWSWVNVPLPEPHLAATAAGTIAHWLLPARVPLDRRTARMVGWSAICAGAGFAVWAVRSASTEAVTVDRPTSIVTSGAFAVSRNPMYLGWTTALFGLAIARRSAWMLAAGALAAVRTHREILAEEAALNRAFGDAYEAYAVRTPRYLAGRPRRRSAAR